MIRGDVYAGAVDARPIDACGRERRLTAGLTCRHGHWAPRSTWSDHGHCATCGQPEDDGVTPRYGWTIVERRIDQLAKVAADIAAEAI